LADREPLSAKRLSMVETSRLLGSYQQDDAFSNIGFA
jgi:hypothetical protein